MTTAITDAHRAVVAVWRIEQPRLITSLARILCDVPLAEDLTQEALLAAIERWPSTGVPEKPGAWLMAAAKRKALDHLRRRRMLERKHLLIISDMEAEQGAVPDLDSDLDDDIGDEMLRLIFTACHPRLSHEARAALALRMVCGLTTSEIARAFLVPEATIAQRVVRAKRTLSESGLTYETPRRDELSERLSSVLEVIYLIFNEGYTAAHGDDWLRPQLCDEGLRLGRVPGRLHRGRHVRLGGRRPEIRQGRGGRGAEARGALLQGVSGSRNQARIIRISGARGTDT